MMFLCDINVFYRFGKHVLEDMLAPYQMDMHELITVLSIHQSPGITQSSLSMNLQMDKGNLTKFLQHLEEKGVLYREVESQDRRHKKCYLTERSKALVPKLDEVKEQWTRLCFEGLSEKELQQYKNISSRITENLLRHNK